MKHFPINPPTINKGVLSLKNIREKIPKVIMLRPKADIFSLPILSDKYPLTGATTANTIGETVIINPAMLGPSTFNTS